ncbi:Sigma-70 family RNA polymerase sigma factor, partial [Dysosmobacter welbionis]
RRRPAWRSWPLRPPGCSGCGRRTFSPCAYSAAVWTPGKKSAWSTRWRSRSRRSPLFSAEPGAGRSAGPHRPRRTRRRL